MPDITRLNVQGNKNRNFIVRTIDYIEPKKAITNKTLSIKNTRLGDYKLIGFLDNPIASFKNRISANQVFSKCGYMHDVLKGQNFPGGHPEINASVLIISLVESSVRLTLPPCCF